MDHDSTSKFLLYCNIVNQIYISSSTRKGNRIELFLRVQAVLIYSKRQKVNKNSGGLAIISLGKNNQGAWGEISRMLSSNLTLKDFEINFIGIRP
jgi:hypothetical protein